MQDDIKPSDVSHLDTSRLSRRTLMKELSAVGFGAISAATLTADDVKAASSDEVPITYAMEADDKMRTSYTAKKRMVPADWYEDVQRAHRAHDNYGFDNIPGIVGTTVLPGTFSGNRAQIQVEISPELARDQGQGIGESRGKVPEQIEQIPTKVVESSKPKLGCYTKDYGSEPPVGSYVSGSKFGGSLGCPIYKDGNAYFSTNYHLWTDQDNLSYANLENSNNDVIGYVVDWDCKDDFVAASPAYGYSVNRELVDAGGNYILGYYTKAGIDGLAANDEYARKRGQTTCYTAGEIKGQGDAYAYDADCPERLNQVKWGKAEDDFTDGDSGSVAYASPYDDVSDDRKYALCINAARVASYDPTGDYVYGTAGWHIHNEYGYGF